MTHAADRPVLPTLRSPGRRVDDHALGRFVDGTGEFTGLVHRDRVIRLEQHHHLVDLPTGAPGTPTIQSILDHWPAAGPRLTELARSLDPDGGVPLTGLRVLEPVQPRQILQAGANYRDHLVEMLVSGQGWTHEDAARHVSERARTGSPFLISGMPAALCGPDDDIRLPEESQQVDWEAELAVVIGSTARQVARENALDHVAGYTVCNDISARDLQFPSEHKALGGDWVRAKNRPTFLPTGPFLVPADQISDYRTLRITLTVNGELRQDDVPASMLFDVESLIVAASRATTLYPGDLVLTGSPAGNGGHWQQWLQPGDVVEAAIAGIGAQHNTCVPDGTS